MEQKEIMLRMKFPNIFSPKTIRWESIVYENGSVSQKQDLRIGAEINHGKYGTVYRGEYCLHHWEKPDDLISVAVKKVFLKRHEAEVHRELESLITLREERGIIHLFNYKETSENGLFVFELCEGGDLIDYVLKKPLTEAEAKKIIRWLCETVQRCHDHGIVHTDIKLDNIGIVNRDSIEDLRILDFGNSKIVGETYEACELLGSPHYTPPEISTKATFSSPEELFAIDMWCVGICAYCLIEGCFPFEPNHQNSLKFSAASLEARDFIRRILTKVKFRATIAECLQHEWLR